MTGLSRARAVQLTHAHNEGESSATSDCQLGLQRDNNLLSCLECCDRWNPRSERKSAGIFGVAISRPNPALQSVFGRDPLHLFERPLV